MYDYGGRNDDITKSRYLYKYTYTRYTRTRPSRRKPASRGASLRPRRKQQIFHYLYVQMAPLMTTRANISDRIERNFVHVCVSLGRSFDDADWQVDFARPSRSIFLEILIVINRQIT